MVQKVYRKIVDLVLEAAKLARSVGIHNILQPGLVKEMIIADLLGHDLIHSKRDSDACAPGDPGTKYEYLSCKEGGTGQFDRMFKSPQEKRAESFRRITRNCQIYFAVFFEEEQTKCKVIYELDTTLVLQETERQLNRSRNAISHVGFSEKWARENGRIVYQSSSNT